MRSIKLFYVFSCLVLFFIHIGFAMAYESLDELEARTSRKGANSFYTGESSENYYIRQSQLCIYKDTTTNHEIILWSQTPNLNTIRSSTEYGWQPWSADGKRMAFVQEDACDCYTLVYGYPWYVAKSDGTYWRPVCSSVNRTDVRRPYFDWSPTIPDVAYTVGYNQNGASGSDQNAIYKETITDISVSSSLIVDMITGDTSTIRIGGMKNAITSDGLYYLSSIWAETEPFYIAQIEPSGSRSLKLTYNQPALDTYWADTPSTGQGDWHDEMFTGNASIGYWIYLLHTAADWWRMRPWGTDSNAPNHTIDHSSPYDWWEGTSAQKEIQCVNGNAGTLPDFVDDYWSHGVVDRWGTHVSFSDTDASPVSPGVFDVENSTQTGLFTTPGGTQYHAWTGWTDYTANSCGSPAVNVCIVKYNSTNNADHAIIAYLHSATSNEFTKPGQSPDGTKIAMRSDWLNSGSGIGDLFIAIAYYPHPPQITSCTASSGIATIQFDWRLATTPRGYTERGWPDENADDPPPPREIEKFRLWRSTDKTTWVPIKTVNYDIFSRYDFSDGTWPGNSYWTITDTPGNGTWYYAITSVEWSGLESRTLSNIYSITISGGSGTGSQDTDYPSSPGDLDDISTSDFYTSYNSSNTELIRYYNIYAEDGSSPSISQTNIIASVPASVCSAGSCSWVDWLGNVNGSTQYVVTAVDTQGNESNALTNVVYTHKKPPATADGQYTITWDDESGISFHSFQGCVVSGGVSTQ